MELTNDEIRRYSRHLMLPEVGVRGQKKIKSTSVLCVGAGGLGSPIAMYLVAAGIGRLGLADGDAVEVSNLQRQLLHGAADVGRAKTDSASQRLRDLNPGVELQTYPMRLTRANASEILARYDIVVDGTDNFPTRYLINDLCVFLKKPNVYGSIFRWEGQSSLFAPHLGGPCYRCLYPEPPPPELTPSCAEGGVLGVLPGIIGCIQATEILKLALGKGASLLNRLLLFNALDMSFRELKLRRDPHCPVCGESPTIREPIDYEDFCRVGEPPSGSLWISHEVTVHQLKQALDTAGSDTALLDVREPHEREIANIAGAVSIPLDLLPKRWAELDTALAWYVYCRNGVRSKRAVDFLRSKGFQRAKNVRGGIAAWAAEIDPEVPEY